jgi:hypothetical protein
VSRKPNKGLSRWRRGFPVRLSAEHVLMLHLTYVWMQKHGQTTPELDALMLTLPPAQEAPPVGTAWSLTKLHYRIKTLRVRGPEVPLLIALLERALLLPFMAATLRSRLRDFKALNTMDLMVDAQRE